jgi:adenylate kinase family enzyme
VLSSVGRWEGEEYPVIEAAEDAGHPIKAVILLNISEAEAKKRWQTAKTLMDRGEREDDKESSAFDKRIDEFIQKTMPVIETYQKRGVLVSVPATADREAVYQKVIEELAIKAHEIDREII